MNQNQKKKMSLKNFMKHNKMATPFQYLKDNIIQVYRIILGVVIVGKIASRFLNLSDDINTLFTTALFSLIGLTYLVFSWAFNTRWLKLVFALCGIYLIVMNFIPKFSWSSIIGIICIVTPMIIGQFLPEED